MYLLSPIHIIYGANLSQDEIAAARPDIDEKTAQLVSKGRWQVPGYKVCVNQSCHRSTSRSAAETQIGKIWRSLIAIIDFYLSFLSLCTIVDSEIEKKKKRSKLHILSTY
jgi:hypothetical protein